MTLLYGVWPYFFRYGMVYMLSWNYVILGDCQNYGPFLVPACNTAPSI